MIARRILPARQEALSSHPAVALLGPRRVGKTTLAHIIAAGTPSIYLDLEASEDRAHFADPTLFVNNSEHRPVVPDEFHYGPKQSPALRGVIDSVHLMENHDEAYYIWRDAAVREKVLVHIDAHHDMWWVKDKALITIANFICPALKEGLVREVYWVVPDAAWETRKTRALILRHLKAIAKGFSEASLSQGFSKARGRVAGMENGRLTAKVLGKSITVCPLGLMPHIDENVLLDIDTDYLVIPRVAFREIDEHSLLPWLWPGELLERISAARIRSNLATVVYSVEGSYTPLKWKYLGDELVARLRQETPAIQGMARISQGACAEERGETEEAEKNYIAAASLLPDSAAPLFRLAQLYATSGRAEESRECYRRAVERDPSYRTPYNSLGFHYYWRKRFGESEREHLRTLAMDPENAYACLGLAQIALRGKKWHEAEMLLRQSLAADDTLVDAHRELGAILTRRHRYGEAIQCYERSMKLALAGHQPLSGLILTNHEPHRLLDPWHSFTHRRLARLYTLTGAVQKAVAAYRISIATGCNDVGTRFQLAWLYLRQGFGGKAAVEGLFALGQIPASARKSARRAWYRLIRAARKAQQR